MRVRWLLLFVLALAMLVSVGGRGQIQAAPAAAVTPVPGACTEGSLASGARARICVPASGWNGDLVVWAHGYVIPGEPELTFQDELPGNPPIALPTLVQSLGYAYAATTYAENGLVVIQAQADILELLERFKTLYQEQTGTAYPGRVFLAGASMGGLITTLLAEKYPGTFAGALAACGIVGDFRRHVNYWGDFRVVFDYFFDNPSDPAYPRILPTAEAGLGITSAAWAAAYAPRIATAVAQNPSGAQQLVAVTKAPVAANSATAVLNTIQSLAFYSALSAGDTAARLGGNPFENRWRWYWGSSNDLLLNLRVRRFSASPAALSAIRADYETSGKPRIPIVMPHTTQDEVVRFEQTLLYWLKARPEGAGRVTPIPIARFGHCSFTTSEIVLSFAVLVSQATGGLPAALAAEVDELDLAAFEAELAAQLAAFNDAEAADAAQQAQASWHRVYLPLVVR